MKEIMLPFEGLDHLTQEAPKLVELVREAQQARTRMEHDDDDDEIRAILVRIGECANAIRHYAEESGICDMWFDTLPPPDEYEYAGL